jgi:hypothetical protein
MLSLWIEIIIFLAVVIFYIIKFIRFWRQGIKIKQMALWKHGQMLTLIGILAGVGLPKIMGLQNDLSYRSQEIYLAVSAICISIFIIGLQLAVASYKTEDENPKWIKKILNVWK